MCPGKRVRITEASSDSAILTRLRQISHLDGVLRRCDVGSERIFQLRGVRLSGLPIRLGLWIRRAAGKEPWPQESGATRRCARCGASAGGLGAE